MRRRWAETFRTRQVQKYTETAAAHVYSDWPLERWHGGWGQVGHSTAIYVPMQI